MSDQHGDHEAGPSPLVTLYELKTTDRFPRYQDRPANVSGPDAPFGFPLVTTRLQPNSYIDLLLNNKWECVEFVGKDKKHIHYRRDARDEKIEIRDPWGNDTEVATSGVAPAGLYTRFQGDTSAIASAKLADYQSGTVVRSCEVRSISPPYVTLQIDFSSGPYASGTDYRTYHVADPRIDVPGVVPRRPYYHTPIALSHRWLGETHPDPDGVQLRELLQLSERLGFLDCQAFFIDYCSLPQTPRTPEEENLFRRLLLATNSYYQRSTIILSEETNDYNQRAWCMFELILSAARDAILNRVAVEGKLARAFDLARSFTEISAADFVAKQKFGMNPGRTFSTKQLQKWMHASQGYYRVMHELKHHTKDSVLKWFQEHDLKAANMADIPVIVDLLDSLI